MVELVLDRLRAGGHRITTARRAIIASLARSEGHPTVEQISADVEARTPGLYLSTIYRTLETLAEFGLATLARCRTKSRSFLQRFERDRR